MTYQELETRLTKMLETPDTALAVLPEFLKEVKTDYEKTVSLETKIAEGDKRIRDLQDTNMKLFLMQTSAPKTKGQIEEEEDDLEGQDAIDAFIKDIDKEEE